MTPALARRLIIGPTLALLAERGIPSSPQAVRMLGAIAYQESGWAARVQRNDGPAHGFWQFERGGGVHGVLTHRATADRARDMCRDLVVSPDALSVHICIANNDILACAFARMLLWTDPAAIPTDQAEAWAMYLRCWQPGKPHPDRWPSAWAWMDGGG